MTETENPTERTLRLMRTEWQQEARQQIFDDIQARLTSGLTSEVFLAGLDIARDLVHKRIVEANR